MIHSFNAFFFTKHFSRDTPALDPYAEFLKNHKKREANWKGERAAKRTRLGNSEEMETPQICLDERVKRNIKASSDEA